MKKIILILIILSTMFMIGCSNEYSSFMNDCLTNKRAEKENTKEVKNDKRH